MIKNVNQKKKNGTAIVYSLVVMFVVSIVLTSLLGYITTQMRFSLNRVEREKSFQIAEAGILYYRWYLAHKTSGKTAQQIIDFWTSGNPIGVGSAYEEDYGDGKYSIQVTAPSAGSTIVTVKSTGWTTKMPDVKRTVQVRFRRPSWSEYVFLSNSFMNFGDEAEVYGKVHSNFGIRFDGIAHNTVSSLLPSFDDPTHGGTGHDFGVHTHQPTADPSAPNYPWAAGTVPNRPDIFIGGREFPVPEVSFSGVTSDLAAMKSAAQGGHGKYFDASGGGRRIILKTNGTYDLCTVDTYSNNQFSISKYKKMNCSTGAIVSGTCNSCSSTCLCNYSIPNEGVIFVENNAWVEGTVNGKRVSIVAANLSGGGNQANIYVGFSNLRYTSYDCNNNIGLVAQQDITVVKDCPDDYIIDAALLAQGGKVGIAQTMASKTSLTFNGAIVSYLQPYFQKGVSGFAVRYYNYDNNLLYCPPPYFPTGTEYAIDLWEEL